MPITGKDWKAGRTIDSKEAKIIRFLKSHYDSEDVFQAYTWTEIALYSALPDNATQQDANVQSAWQLVLAGVSLFTHTSLIDTSVKDVLEDLIENGEVIKHEVVNDYGRLEFYYRYGRSSVK